MNIEIITHFIKENLYLTLSLVLLIYILIILFKFSLLKYKTNKLFDFVSSSNKLGKNYILDSNTSNNYDINLLEKYLINAINELIKDVNIITSPYFYSKSIDDILNKIPTYIDVLKFSKYCYNNIDIYSDIIHKLLIKNYGENYNDKLTFDINETGFSHSILIDLTKSIYLYKKYQSYVDKII